MERWQRTEKGHTYHEEVAPSHPDDADVREGLHDVVERGGGESMDTLCGVGRDGVLCQLPDMHPIREVRSPLFYSTPIPEPFRVPASTLTDPRDTLDYKRVVPEPVAT